MRLRNVIFYTSDMARSKIFYTQVLGLEVCDDFGHFVSYKTDEKDLWFSVDGKADGNRLPGNQTCVFWIENIDELFQRLKSQKVKIITEPTDVSFGRWFEIADPDDNKIEFVEL